MISAPFKTSQQLYFAPNATLPFDHFNGPANINPQNASALKRELCSHLVAGKTILALSLPPPKLQHLAELFCHLIPPSCKMTILAKKISL